MVDKSSLVIPSRQVNGSCLSRYREQCLVCSCGFDLKLQRTVVHVNSLSSRLIHHRDGARAKLEPADEL